MAMQDQAQGKQRSKIIMFLLRVKKEKICCPRFETKQSNSSRIKSVGSLIEVGVGCGKW